MTIAIDQLTQQYPLIEELISLKETSWFNPAITSFEEGLPHVGLDQGDIKDASDRLSRFAPYLAHVFPETKESNGIIESDVVTIPSMKAILDSEYATHITGRLMLKKTVTYLFQAQLKPEVVSMRYWYSQRNWQSTLECSMKVMTTPYYQPNRSKHFLANSASPLAQQGILVCLSG